MDFQAVPSLLLIYCLEIPNRASLPKIIAISLVVPESEVRTLLDKKTNQSYGASLDSNIRRDN